MVIIYIIITMIVGAGILALGSLDRIEANRRLRRGQAFYLAEAGINYAYYRLENNPSDNLTGPYNFENVAFQISDTVTGDTRTIISTGTIKNVSETVAINVTKGGSKLFGRGLFGTEEVGMEGYAYIDSYDSRIAGSIDGGEEGHVGSDTTILIPDYAEVHGDARSAGGPGSIVLGNNGILTGEKDENAQPRTLDPVPMVVPSDLLGPLSSPKITPLGSYTLTANGILTIKTGKTANMSGGNFRFKQIAVQAGAGQVTTLNFTGTVRIYVTDSLTTGDKSRINFQSPSQNELYMGSSPGNITMNSGSTISTPDSGTALGIYVVGSALQEIANSAAASFYAVIYAPSAKVTLLNGKLWGDIVANDVLLKQNATVHYDVALRSSLPPGDPGGVSTFFINWTKPDWKIE